MVISEAMLNEAIQRLVMLSYQRVLYIDFSEDYYCILKAKNDGYKVIEDPISTKVTDWFSYFAESSLCYEEDRARFRSFSKIDHLVELIEQNDYKTIRIRFRRKLKAEDKDFHFAIMEIVPDKDESGHLVAFVFVKDLFNGDDEKFIAIERVDENRDVIKQVKGKTHHKVLIIEDNDSYRQELASIVSSRYDVLLADNGYIGLDILQDHYAEISMILLDASMPVMNGLEFLREVQSMSLFATIPVVVTIDSDNCEEELKCLDYGAMDFITKPYNEEVIFRRIRSIMKLWDSSKRLSELEYDELTGLYTKQAFFHHAERLIRKNPDKEFCLVISDLENFKMVNERYGEQKGDEILQYVAKCMLSNYEGSLCGRYNGDVFACMAMGDFVNLDALNQIREDIVKNAPVPNLSMKFGVYLNVEKGKPIATLCDRAKLAMNSIKNNYGVDIAVYNQDMSKALHRKQEIIDCMEDALKQKQFKVYYQPKHDIKTNKIAGAEALVRWIHPDYGFMSPADFIPIFEMNGFISKLDYYVWERTCQNQKEWMDEGLPVVPISVNSSRKDILESDYVKKLIKPLQEQGIKRDLLHVEITESLCMDSTEYTMDILSRIRAEGIKIEMDDFGSGYSSLNMLSSIPIDVLKLDMKFLGDLDDPKKKNILSCCIDLAQKLNYKVVAEGVEELEQIDVLREMNCDLVQGYYYAKPMPEAEFKEYLKKHC